MIGSSRIRVPDIGESAIAINTSEIGLRSLWPLISRYRGILSSVGARYIPCIQTLGGGPRIPLEAPETP